MQQSNYRAKTIDIKKAIGKTKIRLQNVAERSTRVARRELEKEIYNIRDLAMKYAPHKSGFLDNPRHWRVEKNRSGINRRNVYTLLPRVALVQRYTNEGRRVTLGQYVHIRHDASYKIGQESKNKASRLGLAKFPVTSGKYVGHLFLTRAAKQRRLSLINNVRKAVNKVLKR